MQVDVLVLNYNGQKLLAECLPSVVAAAQASRHACRVTVVDNSSTDGSLDYLAQHFPEVSVVGCPNRGLCSFNEVLARLTSPIALLLNNDIRLDQGAIDPLVAPLLNENQDDGGGLPSRPRRCFMTAPLCWLLDGQTYEGLKTSVRWRCGLVQATSQFEGHEAGIYRGGWTASAGAALAVDRALFLELGGFDPLYLPGRLEDLDFAFRGYLAGYYARYVPEAVAFHVGMATFADVYGRQGCDELALRNTLLFQWKNLRRPAHVARQAVGLPLRLARDFACAPWRRGRERLAFARALLHAARRYRRFRPARKRGSAGAEAEFFRLFSPRRMVQCAASAADCPV